MYTAVFRSPRHAVKTSVAFVIDVLLEVHWMTHFSLAIILCAFFLSVLRDISERGRELEQVLAQYITFVKPAFEEFCLPVSEVRKLICWYCQFKLCTDILGFKVRVSSCETITKCADLIYVSSRQRSMQMWLFHAEQTTLVRAVIRQYAEAAIVLVNLGIASLMFCCI